VTRQGVDSWVTDVASGVLAHWEPEVPPSGRIGTAVIVPGGFREVVDAAENRLALVEIQPERPFVYYVGAGWNQSGDFGDAAAWETYVRDFAGRLASPLVVNVPTAQP
jgi:hypothetical protein